MADSAEQLKLKGNSAFATQNWTEAADWYNKAIKADSTIPTYYSNLAACYIKLCRFSDGITCCEKGLSLLYGTSDTKTQVKLWWRLGLCHLNLNDNISAKEKFQNGLKIDPANKSLLDELQKLSHVPDVVSRVPVSIVDSLPERYRSKTRSISDQKTSQETPFIPPKYINMYSLSQLLRTPASQLESAYKFAFDIPISIYTPFISQGIEHDLMDFIIQSALSCYDLKPHDQWISKTRQLLEELPKTPRFSLTKMLMASDVDKLINLLDGHLNDEIKKNWS